MFGITITIDAIKYLKDNGILFVIRLPKHHLVTRLDGSVLKIEQVDLGLDKTVTLKDCLVYGVVANVWVK